MKASLIVVCMACLICSVGGCGGAGGKKSKNAISKSFYGRTIEYNIDPAAKEHLSKLELLVGRAQKIDPPVPDELIVPLYRDADTDRDHYITKTEAEIFYDEYILKFEDSLGPVKMHNSN